MSDAAALLAAIRAAPEDDAPRLVYADWLEEHGQPEWAEFIRVQCQLARHQKLQSSNGDEIVALWHREDELLANHYEHISGLKASEHRLKFSRGFPSGFGDITFFAGRRPSRSGTWTHLLFGFDSTVRRIETNRSAGDLVAFARSHPDEPARRDSVVDPGRLLHRVGAEFFRHNGCVCSETRYVFNSFEYPPTVAFQNAEYRITADRIQLHLDPIDAPYPSEPSTPGFDSFTET